MFAWEKCVVYFYHCTGVLIRMSYERVSGAVPQRIDTNTLAYTHSHMCVCVCICACAHRCTYT